RTGALGRAPRIGASDPPGETPTASPSENPPSPENGRVGCSTPCPGLLSAHGHPAAERARGRPRRGGRQLRGWPPDRQPLERPAPEQAAGDRGARSPAGGHVPRLLRDRVARRGEAP